MPPINTPSRPSRYPISRVILWTLLLLAAAEFVIRGPLRYLRPSNWSDLAQYYAASRIWLRGQNFAKPENFVALWRDEVGSTLGAYTIRTHIAPPLGALVLFAPVAVLPWPAAKIFWLFILLAAFSLAVWCCIRIAGFPFNDWRAMLFTAGCLALAPFHTGIASANQTIVVVGLCAAGIWAGAMKCDLTAGLLLGGACSLKPHIAGFLFLYYLIRQRWRLVATAIGFAGALVLLATAWMHFAGVNWFPDYLNNIRFAAARNTIDDFTSANSIRFMLINLQVPFFSITRNGQSSNLLAFCTGGLLILSWILLVLQNRSKNMELLSLATVGVIGLLPLYHRLYDASILVIPLCWCLTRPEGLRKVSNAALLLMAPFLVPGAALLQEAVRSGRVPDAWLRSWWWEDVVMPHQTWFLLALSIVLLYAMAKQSRNVSLSQDVPDTSN